MFLTRRGPYRDLDPAIAVPSGSGLVKSDFRDSGMSIKTCLLISLAFHITSNGPGVLYGHTALTTNEAWSRWHLSNDTLSTVRGP